MLQRAVYAVTVGLFLFGAGGVPSVAGKDGEVAPGEVPQGLFNYVAREDKAFRWELKERQPHESGAIYDVALTSQEWQGIPWQHALQIYEPAQVRYPRHVLLFVTGGSNGGRPGNGDRQRGLALAQLCSARVAVIHQVPNQPLLGDRKEDDLITETWLRYLETGDENWPLLFPMVKSAVRAMDAVQALAEQHWNSKVESFVITGASKRGWTSWLTPVADKRIVATAPIVIDVLNFRPQMQYQLDTWGKYSEQIADYTSKGLVKPGDETPREMQLRLMMDPYTYRQQLTLPKLMVNGTNDRYWVVDAMKHYWHDLPGPKYVLQVPNAGHSLEGGHELALSTIAAFFQHNASNTSLPQVSWERSFEDGAIVLRAACQPLPEAARLWVARSDTKDFREAKWESQPLQTASETYAAELPKPTVGHIAHYAEFQFQIHGVPYSLCTIIQRD